MSIYRTSPKHYQSIQSEQKFNIDEQWKQKYELLQQQFSKMREKYEVELLQLTKELQELMRVVDNVELNKQADIIKNKTIIENKLQEEYKNRLQSQKLLNEQSKQQIEQYKIQIEELQFNINELQQKLLRQKIDDDRNISDLLNENFDLRKQVQNKEIEKQNELKTLQNYLQNQQELIVQNLNKQKQSSNVIVENELLQLKKLIEVKNQEISSLMIQNQKLRTSFQSEIQELNKEIIQMQDKILQQEQQSRFKQETIKSQKIEENLKNQSVIKNNYDQILQTLEQENLELKDIINNNSLEQQKLQELSLKNRDHYDNQIRQALINIQLLETELSVEKESRFQEVSDLNRLRELDYFQQNDLIEKLRDEVQFLQKEIELLKGSLNDKQKQQESGSSQHLLQFQQTTQLQQQIEILQQEQQIEQKELEDVRMRQQQLMRDRANKQEIQIEKLLNQQKQLELTQEQVNQQNSLLQITIDGLKEENKSLNIQVQQHQLLQIQIDQEMLIRQKQFVDKMQNNLDFQVQQIKSAMNTQVNILEEENKTLRYILDQRKHQE
ncbi:hypothetical protein pb186bvf_017860 [Paramecium bursaria]